MIRNIKKQIQQDLTNYSNKKSDNDNNNDNDTLVTSPEGGLITPIVKVNDIDVDVVNVIDSTNLDNVEVLTSSLVEVPVFEPVDADLDSDESSSSSNTSSNVSGDVEDH